MKKRGVVLICAVILLAVAAVVFFLLAGRQNQLVLYTEEAKCTINGKEYPIQSDMFLYNGNTYFPVSDVLKECGYTIEWDAASETVTMTKKDTTAKITMNSNEMLIGEEKVTFEQPAFFYYGRSYINVKMFQGLTGYEVEVVGHLPETSFHKRDLMENTEISDDFRLPNQNVGYFGGVTIVDGFAMERLSIPQTSAESYAQVVNTVADALPDVQVYCISVPTASEFYAPKDIATNQLSGIKTIYSNLDEKVMPINVVDPLMEHADEKIYFSTDHHWTQRGAYYAYQAFAENRGVPLPPLTDFQTSDYDSHIGSFAGFTRGTAGEAIVRSHPEVLERFLPLTFESGVAYKDQKMTNNLGPVTAVNTNSTTYACFIGGDRPLTELTSTVKNGKKLVITKESFGNAFATWALNNYEKVYVIDPREFNGFNGKTEPFSLKEFYEQTQFDDLVMINYPAAISASAYRESLLDMVK